MGTLKNGVLPLFTLELRQKLQKNRKLDNNEDKPAIDSVRSSSVACARWLDIFLIKGIKLIWCAGENAKCTAAQRTRWRKERGSNVIPPSMKEKVLISTCLGKTGSSKMWLSCKRTFITRTPRNSRVLLQTIPRKTRQLFQPGQVAGWTWTGTTSSCWLHCHSSHHRWTQVWTLGNLSENYVMWCWPVVILTCPWVENDSK